MAKPYFHAQSSAKKYGGIWQDYMSIHEFMDSSKAAFPDNRHRVLTHNSWFVGVVLPRVFGETFRRESDNKIVCTRDIGEQHCLEDFKFKFMPSAQDYIQEMDFLPWMQNGMGESPSSHKKLVGEEPLKTKKTLLTEEVKEEDIPKINKLSEEVITKATKTISNRKITHKDNIDIVYDGNKPNFGLDYGRHNIID
jgi:hypothetical protein